MLLVCFYKKTRLESLNRASAEATNMQTAFFDHAGFKEDDWKALQKVVQKVEAHEKQKVVQKDEARDQQDALTKAVDKGRELLKQVPSVDC